MSFRRQTRDRQQFFFLQQINQAREQGNAEQVKEKSQEFIQDQVTQRIVDGVNDALTAVANGYNQQKNHPS